MAAISSAGAGNWSDATKWTAVSRTGTITTSNVATSLVGVATLFLTELAVGSVVKTGGGTTIGTIATITDNLNATFTGNAASTNAGIAYTAQVVPKNGDTVSIAHAVSVDVNTTVGRSLQGAGWKLVTVAATGGSGGTSALPTGAYRIAYTIDDGAGGETSAGLTEANALTITNGSSSPLITFPAAPPTGCTYSLYLTNTGGGVGTERRYVTGITTATYGATFASQWENNTVAFASGQAMPVLTGTCAIVITSTGTLSIAGGVTLAVRGDINQNTGTMTWAAGASLVFDPTQCGSSAKRAQAKYAWNPVNGNSATWTCNGTNGSHCTVKTLRTNGDEGTAFMALPSGSVSTSQGLKTVTFTDFLDFSQSLAAQFGLAIRDDITSSSVVYSVTDSTFTRCNLFMGLGQTHTWDSSVTFQRNKFLSSVGVVLGGDTVCMQMSFQNDITNGTRLIDLCAFDLKCSINNRNVTMTNNVFSHGLSNVTTSSWASDTQCANNFFYINDNTDGAWLPYGSIKNCYVYDSWTSNPHPVLWAGAPTTITMTGCIGETADPTSTGEFWQPNKNTSGSTFVAKNNIMLPAPGGYGCAMFAYNGGTSTTKFTAEHNTCFSATENGFMNVGETVAEVINTIVSLRANLICQPSPSTRNFVLIDRGTPAVTDVVGIPDAVTYFGCNHNALWNGSTGTINANGSNVSAFGYSALTPGTFKITGVFPSDQVGNNDVDLGTGTDSHVSGPLFTDSTRNLGSWGTTQGGDGTPAGALAILAANPTLIAQPAIGLLAWVREGFRPRAVALKGASYAGDASTADANGNVWSGATPDIGAMAWTPAGGAALMMGM